MTPRHIGGGCPRRWQVEAARDGRLVGRDLETAVRHREHCPPCAAEARDLVALTRCFESLPQLPRDPLSVRRQRQQLMAALNETLIAPLPRRSRRQAWALAALAVVAAAVGLLLPWHHRVPPVLSLNHLSAPAHLRAPAPPPTAISSAAAVEVHASKGARWLIHSDATEDRVELSEGVATFDVHPHPGRRVIVQLPDGQLEDLGTTFEVAVRSGHTERIMVSRGRVLVRIGARAEFSLQVGEQWQRDDEKSWQVRRVSRPEARHSAVLAPVALHGGNGSGLPSVSLAPPTQPQGNADTLERASRLAEDAAYLGMLSLLRQQRYPEACAQAKRYLLDFPNGFRRIEVLNVATGGEGPRRSR